MNTVLVLLFLFSMGCTLGWGIEVLFRKFFSSNNPKHRWVNPGFLTGPYLPIYGFGLVILFLIASLEGKSGIEDPIGQKLALFASMAVCMTMIEYAAGLALLKLANVRLWDYRERWGNIQGLICPLFSLFWSLFGALYYFLVHPHILNALYWLASNLAFSFFIGLFYGVFLIDVVHSTNLLVAIRRFAAERQIVVRYEELRDQIREHNEARLIHAKFLFSMRSDIPLREHLEIYNSLQAAREKRRLRAKQISSSLRDRKKK